MNFRPARASDAPVLAAISIEVWLGRGRLQESVKSYAKVGADVRSARSEGGREPSSSAPEQVSHGCSADIQGWGGFSATLARTALYSIYN